MNWNQHAIEGLETAASVSGHIISQDEFSDLTTTVLPCTQCADQSGGGDGTVGTFSLGTVVSSTHSLTTHWCGQFSLTSPVKPS